MAAQKKGSCWTTKISVMTEKSHNLYGLAAVLILYHVLLRHTESNIESMPQQLSYTEILAIGSEIGIFRSPSLNEPSFRHN